MFKRKVLGCMLAFLISLFIAVFYGLFLSDDWLLSLFGSRLMAMVFYFTGLAFGTLTDCIKALFEGLWKLLP